MNTRLALSAIALVLALVVAPAAGLADHLTEPKTSQSGQWYKGQTHCHSFWSDGRTFPELVAKRYKEAGFHFVIHTEHNLIAKGEKWKVVVDKQGKKRDAQAVAEYREVFKDDKGWIVERKRDGATEIRLKQLAEYAPRFNEPGRFLLIQGCETTGKAFKRQIHLNAINVARPVLPKKGKSVAEVINNDVAAICAERGQQDQHAIATLNHPNWPAFDIEAEDIAAADRLRFIEIENLSPGCKRYSDGKHHSVDHKWDIANTLRIGRMNQQPVYGLAIDDAHHYAVDPPTYDLGWIMVRAGKLDVTSLLAAMRRGDFYASTGVTLKDVQYDPAAGTLTVEVDPREGVNYEIRFIGTRKDYDRSTRQVTDHRPDQHTITVYSKDVGKTFETVQGAKATYKLTGDELFVRAHVVSDRKLKRKNQFDKPYTAEAFTQPVGWERHVK